jgi:hypothetical protein
LRNLQLSKSISICARWKGNNSCILSAGYSKMK